MMEPVWIKEARSQLGVAEIPGPAHNPVIQSWLHRLRAWWVDDETPWCGVFVAACLNAVGGELPANWMRARAWAGWGEALGEPYYGCVVVFERQGGGHVGFVVGRDHAGRLLVLGGNQGNKVSIAPFERARAIAYRWPRGALGEIPMLALPLVGSTDKSSINEA